MNMESVCGDGAALPACHLNAMESAETDIDAVLEGVPPPSDGTPPPPEGTPPPPEGTPPPPDGTPPPPEGTPPDPPDAAFTVKPEAGERPPSVFRTVMDMLAAAGNSVEGTEAVS